MDLNILTCLKILNEIVFFQNFQKSSSKKKRLPFFHFLNLSLHKFKRNNFVNWIQISIHQLQKIFFFVLQTRKNLEQRSSQKKKRKISGKNLLLTCHDRKKFQTFFYTNNDKWNKHKQTKLLFQKTFAQKNCLSMKNGFSNQQILSIYFQFFFEKYQYFYFSKNWRNSKKNNRICENFVFKIQPSKNFVNKTKKYKILKTNYWFFQFFCVWDFFSSNSNLSPYVSLKKNFEKNLFLYSKVNRKHISSKIFKKLSSFHNKSPMLQNQLNNNKKKLTFRVSEQFLKNSKKIINRILFFQFSKTPEFFEQNFSIAMSPNFLLEHCSTKKSDFENLFQNMNKSFDLSFELNCFPRKCISKNSCLDKIFNLFVLNFHNIVSERLYETQKCIHFSRVYSFWNKIYNISHENRSDKKFFQNWNPTNHCYVSNNIVWFIHNFEIFQILNVFDFSYISFFQKNFSMYVSTKSKPRTTLKSKLSVFPEVLPLFQSKHRLFFVEKKQKKNIEKNKNKQTILKNISFSIQFIENIHDKIFVHLEKFLTFQQNQQISRMKCSSICFFSVSFFDIFLFPDCFWKNQAKPFILQFVFLYFFQYFLFKNFMFVYLHNSINSYRLFTKFLKHSFVFKNWLFFNIFSKNILFSFQRKIFWFKPKHFSLFFFDRHLYFQKLHWLLPNNSIFLPTSIQKTNLLTISAFSILQCSFNFFSFFFFELKKKPMQNFQFFKKKENFYVNDKTHQVQLFKKFKKIMPFLGPHYCSISKSNANKNSKIDICKKGMCQKISSFQVFDFLIVLSFRHERKIQPLFFFQKKPTRQAIFIHINECQRILQHSIGQTQLTFMKKLQKKIFQWCIQHKSASTKKIFYFCDVIFMKYLWNWAKKSHPNKSKHWIRQKYFHLTSQKKWFFGKKIANKFICLKFHSQFQFA
jgi:hypothetical protein